MASPSTTTGAAPAPAAVFSFLDTDLYKLTMQCAVLKYFPDADVSYSFTNRTKDMLFTRPAFDWLEKEIHKLANIHLAPEEHTYLRNQCPYLNDAYLDFLYHFRLRPKEQVHLKFVPHLDRDPAGGVGSVDMEITGKWVDSILYEIPLLALASEAYFRFVDTDWNYDGQEQQAYQKAECLLAAGCAFSEFGSRRRRDYHTQDLVMRGLTRAASESPWRNWLGRFTGTSNVHFAQKYKVPPIGTVAHEWFMGIAAITNNYEHANEVGLRYWLGCFGEGVLGIALTDTFGTPSFLEAFSLPIPQYTTAELGPESVMPSAAAVTETTDALASTTVPISAPISANEGKPQTKTYAQVYAGVRQDSGDPKLFVALMRKFYDEQGIHEPKSMVFSDSLNVDNCVEYKATAEAAGFRPSFGVGTFLTNDFRTLSTGAHSHPLNIVIKLSSAGGRHAIKISDNLGKNTGDPDTVAEVKRRLGYVERGWAGGDESRRWG